MKKIATFLVGFLLIEHLYICVLEIFFWTTPYGLKAFGLTPDFAEASKTLAMNQGLYNGFLAAGLAWGLSVKETKHAFSIKLFFSSCVLVAGIFGGATTLPKIFVIQALPGLLAVIALVVSGEGKAKD